MEENKQAAPRSIAAIIGIVVGVIAIILSWVPIINNFAFIIGGVGFVIAIVGVVGTVRGKKSGKGLAIAALVVNVLALAIVLGTQSMYSDAIDDAANGPSATGVSQAADTEDDTADETPNDDANYTDLAVGTTVDLENGLSITVNSVQPGLVNFDGATVTGVNVTYVNNGDSEIDYNSYDWKGEDAQGAQTSSTYYSEASSDLGYGSLAAGGTVTGDLYFEGDAVKALYYASALADAPTASWQLS